MIYIAFCGEEKYKTRGTAGLGKVDTFLIRHPVVWRLTETVHWMTTALKYKPPTPMNRLVPKKKERTLQTFWQARTLRTRIMKQSSPNALHMELGFNHQTALKTRQSTKKQKHMSSSIVLTYAFF